MLAWLRRCIIDLLDIYLLWHVSRAYQNPHRLLDALYILVKWILHLVTGRSELSRVLTSRTTTAQLARRGEVVLKTSKTLRREWVIIKGGTVGDGRSDIFISIARKKGILTRGPSARNLERIILLVRRKYDLVRRVEGLRHTPYDKANRNHVSSLNQLWSDLKGTTPPAIPSQDWKELGFQGADPATDLRGMGMLAIHQLVYFCQVPENRGVYQEAQYGPYWYSFAVIGINASAAVVEWLQGGLLDSLIYQSDSGDGEGAGLDLLHAVYTQLMIEFHRQWIRARPANLFAFNDIFQASKTPLIAAISTLSSE